MRKKKCQTEYSKRRSALAKVENMLKKQSMYRPKKNGKKGEE